MLNRRALLAGLPLLAGCESQPPAPAQGTSPGRVVVYTSLDEPYARPILEAFTRDTGIAVEPVYDTEANKSRGLAQKILAEMSRPRADVFWSSEVLQMLRLRAQGALTVYRSPTADSIPARYRDPEGYWTGFAGRFRVLVYHRERVKTPPERIADLTAPRWKGEVAMANPLFGTTTSEAAALVQAWSLERAIRYYSDRKVNQTRIVSGNSAAAERVAQGEVLVGQTDTDDAFVRIDQGSPLEVVFPDQRGMGSFLVPNTAALIRGAPRPDAGQRFLDYLFRPETELMLADLPSRQLPLQPMALSRLPARVKPLAGVKRMEVDYSNLLDRFTELDEALRKIFLT